MIKSNDRTINDRTVIQISKFILLLILQHFLPKFFPQFNRASAKIFINQNTNIFKSFAFFNIFCFFLNLVCVARRGKCPNTEFFLVRIPSECGKIWTRKNSVFGHFSRNVDDSDFSFLLVDDNDQFQDVHFKFVLD